MTKRDWFRRTSWTAADQAEFRARLNRSRTSYHKAQYLRLQALALQEVGGEPMLLAALALLHELVGEYPEPMQLSEAHKQRAECLEGLGKQEDAIAAYRAALQAEREYPNVRGLAYLNFAELVLAAGRNDLYHEALAVLDEFGGRDPFPILEYRLAGARAFLYEALQEQQAATDWARRALSAASKTGSPFRYHRRLGLVDHPDAAIQERLWRLAGQRR